MEAKPAVKEAVFQVQLLYAMMGFHAQLTTAARGLILLIILEHAQLIQLDADALRTASAMIIIPALMISARILHARMLMITLIPAMMDYFAQ